MKTKPKAHQTEGYNSSVTNCQSVGMDVRQCQWTDSSRCWSGSYAFDMSGSSHPTQHNITCQTTQFSQAPVSSHTVTMATSLIFWGWR